MTSTAACSVQQRLLSLLASGWDTHRLYEAMRVPAEHSSALEFWKENGREFPLLAEVARRILCISASSAQSERDFSAVSRTITDARSRLSVSPRTVEAMELIRRAVRGSLLNMDD